MFKALSAKSSEQFAQQLATDMLAELGSAADHTNKKFQAKAGKVLARAEMRIDAFKREQSPNWYQRSRSSNAFLWALKDGGCPEAYAKELTQWFVGRL